MSVADDEDYIDALLRQSDVITAMQYRCKLEGHHYETVTVWSGGFPGPILRRSYQKCDWCGDIVP